MTETEKAESGKSENSKNEADKSKTDKRESGKTRKETRTGSGAESNGAGQAPRPMAVLREAMLQLAELTGMEAESASAFERTEDGWHLEIEVLELTRVPDTMSLLATYAVDLDPEGQLMGYRRVRRYERGRADAQRR
ncbi:gas vesicle protein [Streptomyces sp. TRM66268-LWL]|uniref:Gas vesicle protein n=1 Tax=Streptomyces polyasparticus TaxID=2767826 RepID=A0ABR7SD72_9ACTN|nr:gas vesicle protein [Streptomyces polyasparticus]MBC9713373.1 gas vesicle protein [Streptomyces polyasparticus]